MSQNSGSTSNSTPIPFTSGRSVAIKPDDGFAVSNVKSLFSVLQAIVLGPLILTYGAAIQLTLSAVNIGTSYRDKKGVRHYPFEAVSESFKGLIAGYIDHTTKPMRHAGQNVITEICSVFETLGSDDQAAFLKSFNTNIQNSQPDTSPQQPYASLAGSSYVGGLGNNYVGGPEFAG